MWDPKQILDSVGLGRQQEVKRAVRVADVIKNELSLLLLSKVRDSKLRDVTVTRVEVTDDLRYARVFFTLFQAELSHKAVAGALKKAKGFFRSHLARTLNLRYTPDLQFQYDKTAEKVAEMDQIFKEIADERSSHEGSS